MIDTLEMLGHKFEAERVQYALGFQSGEYDVFTLHRPANVDDPGVLRELCQSLFEISKRIPLVFSIHPRTRKKIKETDLMTIVTEMESLLANTRTYEQYPVHEAGVWCSIVACNY
jgi:UDP-N-acetylglucosamine 2-epimerase (non-hydrolysing)